MRLHREGVAIVGYTLLGMLIISGLLFWLLGGLACLIGVGVFLPLFIFVLHFFRYPKRECVVDAEAIYSPADGRVVVVERVFEPEVFQAECLQISIFMSVWNVHANWYPVAGTISHSVHHPGLFLVAWLPKSSTDNERSSVAITRGDGKQILLRQVAGAVARRIVTYSQLCEEVSQGGEFGFIKFGSRVDVYLPLDAEVQVSVGDRVRGIGTVLARLP